MATQNPTTSTSTSPTGSEAASTFGTIRDEASKVAERLTEKIPSTDEAKDAARNLLTRAEQLIRERPMIAIGAGIALGVALSSFIRSSRHR